MHVLKNNRLSITLSIILVAGFLAVNVTSLRVSSESVRETLVQHELPLTSNNIYSEIQASLLRPIYISSLMAHDTFLKDWMLSGERDTDKVTRYLREIKRKYGVFSTFVVSALSQRYYHFDGVLKRVSPESAKDQWFFTMQTHPKQYRVDLDTNEAANHRLTIFINHKILDEAGRFIGVTGLGLDVATTSQLIEDYKTRYDRDIFFVDRHGMIKSHGDNRLIDRANIKDRPGIGEVAERMLSGDQGSLSYAGPDGNVFVRYRYIPELDWYLLVKQSERQALAPLRHAFYVNLAISAVITLFVLVISGYTVRRFQARLQRMATVDKLSGLFNRQFFEVLFEKAANTAMRQGYDLSLLLFDIDRFKEINDRLGHLAGDALIEQVARVAQEDRRDSDIVARWGGDEFVVLLSGCDEEHGRQIGDALRRRLAHRVRYPNGTRSLTISIGVAGYRAGDDLKDLIARADAKLYAAKAAGRNRVA